MPKSSDKNWKCYELPSTNDQLEPGTCRPQWAIRTQVILQHGNTYTLKRVVGDYIWLRSFAHLTRNFKKFTINKRMKMILLLTSRIGELWPKRLFSDGNIFSYQLQFHWIPHNFCFNVLYFWFIMRHCYSTNIFYQH